VLQVIDKPEPDPLNWVELDCTPTPLLAELQAQADAGRSAALTRMLAHAELRAPEECCGLLVRAEGGALRYVPALSRLRAAPAAQDRFELEPWCWEVAEQHGEVVAVVHSHPNASANPSTADRYFCERSGLPWLIVGWPSGVFRELHPSGWVAPLVGREFIHGVLDCYTLVQDYYRTKLAIALPDFDRDDGWWETGHPGGRKDLYMQHFREAGFVQVAGPLLPHDGILMQVRADVANHAAIYLGDGRILHHLHGRLSCEDVYGGYWQRHTLAVVRHQQLMPGASTMRQAA
jgi:proteasome lid subunit RPN8/RPN11